MTSPIELLTNQNDRERTYLANIWNPFLGASLGFGSVVFVNWAMRKPLLAGIQRHIAIGALGCAFGIYVDGKYNDYMAKRDAVFRHYIELHPEDFPTPERRRWGEILDPWVPIR